MDGLLHAVTQCTLRSEENPERTRAETLLQREPESSALAAAFGTVVWVN